MKVASALSAAPRLGAAITEASDWIELALEAPPDLVLAFASPELEGDLRELPHALADRFAGALIAGCTGAGVLASGRELEGTPALALLAVCLPEGCQLDPVRVPAGAPQLGLRKTPSATLLFTDPFSLDAEALVRSFDAGHPGATLLGGVASGGRSPGEHVLFLDRFGFHEGGVGVAIHGPIVLDTLVSQGCRPIGDPLIVTRAEDGHILAFDRGRPIEVLRAMFDAAPARDRELAQQAVLLGIQMRDAREYHPGDFLIRNIHGMDPARGSIVCAASFEGYPVVQVHVRDAVSSAEDLRRTLAGYRHAERARGALLLTCMGRGAALYGEQSHDSRVLAEVLGPLPVAGFFGNGEIGPVQGRTFVHSYTSAFGILREAEGS